MKAALIVLLIILELPFLFKFVQAYKNFEIIRQVAILIIMIFIGLIFFTVFKFI